MLKKNISTIKEGLLRIRVVEKTIFIALMFVVASSMPFLILLVTGNELLCSMVDVLWMALMTMVVLLDVITIRASTTTKIIIIIGFALHIVVAIWAVYGDGVISDFLHGGDQEGFYNTAISYYNGDYGFEYTRYPYIVGTIFYVFGPFRIIPQFINILFWYLGLKLIERVSGADLYGRYKQLMILFYCLMPNQIIVVSGLYRESIMVFLLMLSTMFLINWQKRGKILDLIASAIVVLPSVLLHTGSIVMWGVILFAFVQWDVKSQCWRHFSYRTILLIIMVFLSMPIYEYIIYPLFPDYLWPSLTDYFKGNGQLINPGRAAYISTTNSVTSVFGLILDTLYRSFYFWVSPTPRFWGSALDVVGFLGDSVPWIIFLVHYIKVIRRKCSDSIMGSGIVLFVLFTFVYGWGTINAGTAMRHRGELIGPLIMFAMIGVSRMSSFNKKNHGFVSEDNDLGATIYE